jgi:hypothetical protein
MTTPPTDSERAAGDRAARRQVFRPDKSRSVEWIASRGPRFLSPPQFRNRTAPCSKTFAGRTGIRTET